MRSVLTSLLAMTLALTVCSCGRREKKTFEVRFKEENLAKGASVVTSENGRAAGRLTDGSAASYWKLSGKRSACVELSFGEAKTFNTVVLRELTDNVGSFSISVDDGGQFVPVYTQDRIGKYRLCYLENYTTDRLRIDFTESRGPIKLSDLEVYRVADRDNSAFRVSEYIRLDMTDLPAQKDDPELTGHFDVITDAILFETIRLDEKGNIKFLIGEDHFADSLAALREIIGGRDIRIWATLLFDFAGRPEGADRMDYEARVLAENRERINESVRAFVEKYGVYGIDYDWEHPTKKNHWLAYNNLICDTAKTAAVSVASVTWGFKFSEEAIAVIDHFNVMAYDAFDARGDHCSSYNSGKNVLDIMLGFGIPREKIFLGIPSYGRPADRAASWPLYRDYPELGKFGNCVEDFTYSVDGAQKRSPAYFNSYALARDKTALCLQMDMGGVMVFVLNGDPGWSAPYSIDRAIYDVLQNHR